MSNKLSHSSVNRFSECPTSWKLHYVDRLRGTTQSAALLFGTAIDKAVELLVTSRDFKAALEKFNKLWEKQEINGVLTELEKNPDIVYATNDLDTELLDETFNKRDYKELLYDVTEKKKVSGFDNLSTEDKIIYNQANWFVAKKRGELMLESVRDEVLPKLKKVHSTQEAIDLTNNEGDSVVGYIDMVAEFEGYDIPIVFDFKTSTKAYEEDSVKTSPQLALYVHAVSDKYKTRKAGFIVLSKQVQKNRKKICGICGNDGSGGRHKTCNADVDGQRCGGEWKETINPKAKIDVIIDDVPERLEEIVLDNMDNTNKMIKHNIYTRNLNNCIKPYGPCVYYNLCHKKSMKGLIKV